MKPKYSYSYSYSSSASAPPVIIYKQCEQLERRIIARAFVLNPLRSDFARKHCIELGGYETVDMSNGSSYTFIIEHIDIIPIIYDAIVLLRKSPGDKCTEKYSRNDSTRTTKKRQKKKTKNCMKTYGVSVLIPHDHAKI